MPPKKPVPATAANDCDEAFWKILKKCDANKVGAYLETKVSDDASRRKIMTTSHSNRDDVPLIFAVNQGADDVVEVLIQHGASVNSCEGRGEKQAAILIACWHGDDVMVQTLVRLGAKLDVVDNKGQGILHACARMSEDGIGEFLLEQDRYTGCNAKVAALGLKDSDGANPLHYALGEAANDSKALRFSEYLLKALSSAVEKDASVTADVKDVLNATTKGTNVTPLHLLLGAGIDNRYVASLCIDMLALGAEHTTEDADGLTPCHIAASAGMTLTLESVFGFLASNIEGAESQVVKIQKLVKEITSVATGQSLLQVAAATRGNQRGVEWVLKAVCGGQPLIAVEEEVKEYVCREDKDDEQAIHAALATGNTGIIQILVAHGASQETVDTFEEEEQAIEEEQEAAIAAEKDVGGKAGDFSGQGSGGARMSAETKQEIEAKIKKAQSHRKAEAASEREAEKERRGAEGSDEEGGIVSGGCCKGGGSKRKLGASQQIPNSKSTKSRDDKVGGGEDKTGVSSSSICVLFLIFFGALMPVWSIFLGTKKSVDPPL